MKNPRKLTYNERKIVASYGLTPMEWGVEKEVKGIMTLRKHITHETIELPKKMKGE